MRAQFAGHGDPAKHRLAVAFVFQTEPRRVGAGQLQGEIDQALSHPARRRNQCFGDRLERLDLERHGGRATRALRELVGNHDVVKARQGRDCFR
ncbi:MAG: hypothetical protein H0W40_09620 [Methylibium sp.]|uniref:hypothetical protein n=1 Tax=Methylibium sp. TaxID=2067992 RepID=UPI0017BA7CAF|nr:hypothetical protein [Methylibium sp.]MBA3597624.1 hypothetical protein [Methylibium sp.]